MTWLITGGCGFIGSNLVDSVLSAGHPAVVLDNLSRVGGADNLEWLRSTHGFDWRFIEGDVRDAALVARSVQETKPDVIAHLAGQVAMTTSIQNPRLDFETNALGSLNILEAARLHSPESALFFSSTNKVYGELKELQIEETATRYVLPGYPHGLGENLPVSGHSPYGCSKLAADQCMLDYHRIYGLATVVFRLSSINGSRQFATFDQGWIGWFIQQVKNEVEFTISGTGKQVRDILHVDDLCQAFFAAARSIDRCRGQAYNLGGGPERSLSILELLSHLEGKFGRRAKPRNIEWRQSDQLVYISDTRRFQAASGWRHATSLSEGLEQAVAWNTMGRAKGCASQS
jgi:CDP-paratose 2-epimerase